MIIIEPCAGLGNRLLALTSAYELAEKLGRALLVIWKSEIGCQIRSEELFLFDGVKVINISESGWKQDFAGTLRGNAVKKKYRGSADRFVECDEVEVWKKRVDLRVWNRRLRKRPGSTSNPTQICARSRRTASGS